MDGIQMTIFDFLKSPSLDDLPEEEMVRRVSEATGLLFKLDSDSRLDSNHYEAKKGKARFSVQYSNYDLMDNKNRFIGIGWDTPKAGGGSPCDSLDEAIEKMRTYMQRATDELRRDKYESECAS